MSTIKKIIKRLTYYLSYPFKFFGWLYGAYLTIRFVDEHNNFPAIVFSKKPTKFMISKANGAQLNLHGRLIIEPWLGNFPSEIKLGKSSSLTIMNDFIIGDDVHIRLSPNATVLFGGKMVESGSGITARSVLLVKESLQIGSDVIIAWDTFISDCDWHKIGEACDARKTIIGDHVWVGNGVKILKGAKIGSNSIIACGAVVVGGEYPGRSLIGGVPARIIKTEIDDWQR